MLPTATRMFVEALETSAVPTDSSPAALRTIMGSMRFEELQALAVGLARSRAGMEQALEDLGSEADVLQRQHRQLHKTLEIYISGLNKLNIGKDNLQDPELAPAESVFGISRRLWERVRPRNTQVLVSEHVGEIRPVYATTDVPYDKLPPVYASSASAFADDLPPDSKPQPLTARLAYLSGGLLGLAADQPQAAKAAGTLAALFGVDPAAAAAPPARPPSPKSMRYPFPSFHPACAANPGELHAAMPSTDGKRSDWQLAQQGKELGRRLSGALSFLSQAAAQDGPTYKTVSCTAADGGGVGIGGAARRGDGLDGAEGSRCASGSSMPRARAEPGGPSTCRNRPPERAPVFGSVFAYLLNPGVKPELGRDSSGPDSPGGGGRQGGGCAGGTPGEAGAAAAGAGVAAGPCPGGDPRGDVSTRPQDIDIGCRSHSESPGGGGRIPLLAPSPARCGARPPSPRSREDSTPVHNPVLLVAKLRLPPHPGAAGTDHVASLRVCAHDRVRTVVRSFIKEHALEEGGFEEPLKAFLAKAEAAAERFPTHLEADMIEMRGQFESAP